MYIFSHVNLSCFWKLFPTNIFSLVTYVTQIDRSWNVHSFREYCRHRNTYRHISLAKCKERCLYCSQLSLSCLSTLLASSQQSFCNLYQFPSSLSEFSQSRYSKQSDPNIVRLVLVYKFIHQEGEVSKDRVKIAFFLTLIVK